MIVLDATTKSLELVTSSSASTDWQVSYADMTTTAFTPADGSGNVASATTTPIVAAPLSSTQRGVRGISIVNKSTTASQTITVQKDVSGTNYTLFTATLQPGYQALYSSDIGWEVRTGTGLTLNQPSERTGYAGYSLPFYKSGSAADAASYWYCYSKDSGFPGAWSPGTPGVGGRTTDGTTSTDAGCHGFPDPSTGSIYLTGVQYVSTAVHYGMLADVLWVNSGLTVTTTTAQNVNSGTLPARDANGSTSGVGCMIGCLTTTANTNAGTISNSTISYTNSSGTSGRTATLGTTVGDLFPATPVIGTVVFFQLAAGDVGVQSIQTITLNTSLGGGAISLFIARPIIGVPTPVANVGIALTEMSPGIRLYNRSCPLWFSKASGTAATTIQGNLILMER